MFIFLRRVLPSEYVDCIFNYLQYLICTGHDILGPNSVVAQIEMHLLLLVLYEAYYYGDILVIRLICMKVVN